MINKLYYLIFYIRWLLIYLLVAFMLGCYLANSGFDFVAYRVVHFVHFVLGFFALFFNNNKKKS